MKPDRSSVGGVAATLGGPSLPNVLLWSAAILALAIFLVDTFSPLQTAVAVFYVIVILLVANASRQHYVLMTSIASAVLTVASYLIVHGLIEPGPPLIRCVVSLSAIGITSFFALRNQTAERVLREQANLLELTHDAIFVRDLNDTITYWNRGAEQLYGWLRHEAVGRHAHRLLRTQFSTPPGAIRAAFLKDGRWEGELIHTGKDGYHVVVASRWSLRRDERGKPVAVLDTNTDITARTQAQEALHTTQSALAHAVRVATLGELTASIAHEVNQPLAAIVTNGEAALRWLARNEPDLQEARAALARVIADGRRASEVIHRIRSLFRKGEEKKASLNVNETLEETLALVQREILVRGISLQWELADSLPPIEADRIQVQQVFTNLIMNALQALDAIERDQRQLTVRSFLDDDRNVNVQVRDNGPGLDDHTEKNLFNAFFTTKAGGMGMGLSICRSIVEAHNGRIWANRNDSRGVTFQLSIPGGDGQ